MTECFIWELVTPTDPFGTDVEVAFDTARSCVVLANYAHSGYPVLGHALRLLRSDLVGAIEAARGWPRFSREVIRVLPEVGRLTTTPRSIMPITIHERLGPRDTVTFTSFRDAATWLRARTGDREFVMYDGGRLVASGPARALAGYAEGMAGPVLPLGSW